MMTMLHDLGRSERIVIIGEVKSHSALKNLHFVDFDGINWEGGGLAADPGLGPRGS